MPSIVMVGPSLDSQGGMATVERNSLVAVREAGYDVTFIPSSCGGSIPRKLFTAVLACARFSRSLRVADVAHIHVASRRSFRRKRLFIRLARRRDVPVLAHLHGSEFRKWYESECTVDEREWIRDTFAMCDKVAVLSEEWRSFILDEGICSAEQMVVLHNAVPIPEEGVKGYGGTQVLFMGRLDERKSPDILIRAAERIVKDGLHIRLVFAGDGDIERYEGFAEQLGIAGHCCFVGWVSGEERERLFLGSSMYCLPSKDEGMPMSVLEAMSYGLATISTPVGGMPQVIEDGKDGLFFPVDDVDGLESCLRRLVGSVEERERIGRAGRAKVIERFSIDSYRRKLIEVYGDMFR